MPVFESPLGTTEGNPLPGAVLRCINTDGAGEWSSGAGGGLGGDAVASYKPMQTASAVFVGGESGIHALGQGTKSKDVTATGDAIVIAFGPAASLPTLLTGSVFCNNVAPGVSFTFGINEVTVDSGTSGSGSFGYDIGTSVYSTVISSGSIGALSEQYFIGDEDPDGQPGSGPWAFTVTPGGVIAAGSVVHVTSAMWVKI